MDNLFISKVKQTLSYKNIVSFLFSVFQLSYIYVLIRQSSYKLLILAFVVPMFMFNSNFIDYYKQNNFKYNRKYKYYIFGIIVFLLSIIMTTSINVELFNMDLGAMSIPANVGRILLFSQLIIFIIFAANKINLKGSKETKGYMFFVYLLPSLLVTGFLFLVYYPGNCSADSISIWSDVGLNKYGDAHPIVYMFLIKGLRLLWDNIAVINLFNVLITSFAFGYVCHQLDRLGVNRVVCIISSIVLPLFPTNALYSVTAWKDIPYTMGLIVLSIMIFKCVATNYYDKKSSFWQIFGVSLFTLFVRHNALISVLLPLFFMGVYYIFKLDKKKIIKTLILGAALVAVFFGTKTLIINALSAPSETLTEQTEDTAAEENTPSYSGNSLLNAKFPKTIALQQIIYVEHFEGDKFTEYEREMFELVVVEEELEYHKQKYADNDIWMFYFKPDKIDAFKYPYDDFWEFHSQLNEKYPELMHESYMKITSIIWCSSPYGSVAYRAASATSIEEATGRTYEPIIKHGIRYKLDNSVFKYVDSSLTSVFWRPALAFILSLILLVTAYKKHGISTILLALPMIFNQLTYILVVSSQDTRYTYVNYTIFIILLVIAVTPKIKKENMKSKQ